MKTLRVVVAVWCVAAGFVRAEPPSSNVVGPASSRGGVTGLGVGLLGVSVAGLVVGLSGVLISTDASNTLLPYGTPTPAEAATAVDLNARLVTGNALILGGFIGAGVALAAGIACLVADSPRPVAVAFVPSRDGGFMSLSLRF